TPEQPTPTPPQPEPEPERPEPEPQPQRPEPEPEVVQQEDPSEVALRQQREREQRQRDEAERRRQQEEAAERRRQQEEADRRAREAAAEAERQRQAEEARRRQEAEADATRSEIGGLFGSGNGRGETGTPGNQGDPNGDPNADNLEGLSTGRGNVSGLGGRNVVSRPTPRKSRSPGTVVINICIDSNGKVTSADYTQSGSSGATPENINIAKADALKYKFSSGSLDKQCGKITYNFKVQ
ncbi:MAG: hypothetical protein AAFQ37_12735, partial [Bacteroidota bacterium]